MVKNSVIFRIFALDSVMNCNFLRNTNQYIIVFIYEKTFV